MKDSAPRSSRRLGWIGAIAITAGLALAAQAAWIPAKAWLAHYLIDRAWHASTTGTSGTTDPTNLTDRTHLTHPTHLTGTSGADGPNGIRADRASNAAPMRSSIRPWPWADTVPIARLRFERLGVDRIVLAGDSGAVLAFGPGHRDGTARPGQPGNAVISAHRDTHFAVLEALRPGDPITVEPAPGAPPVAYRVSELSVIRADDPAAVATVLADDGPDRLTLVTCWPFAGIEPRTPWRYVVTAISRRNAS